MPELVEEVFVIGVIQELTPVNNSKPGDQVDFWGQAILTFYIYLCYMINLEEM